MYACMHVSQTGLLQFTYVCARVSDRSQPGLSVGFGRKTIN